MGLVIPPLVNVGVFPADLTVHSSKPTETIVTTATTTPTQIKQGTLPTTAETAALITTVTTLKSYCTPMLVIVPVGIGAAISPLLAGKDLQNSVDKRVTTSSMTTIATAIRCAWVVTTIPVHSSKRVASIRLLDVVSQKRYSE